MSQDIPDLDLISFLFNSCQHDADRPLIVDTDDPNKSVSWRQMKTLIKQISAGLKSKGVGPGDCVCLHGQNDVYNFAMAYAAIAVGAVYASTSYFLRATELGAAFKACEATWIFVDPEFLPHVVGAASAAGIGSERIFLTDRPLQPDATPVFPSWRSLLQYGEEDWPVIKDREVLKDTVAIRFFTSGSTGPAKVAQLSHFNLVAIQIILKETAVKPYQVAMFYQAPMFHVSSSIMTNAAFLRGHRTYLAINSGPAKMVDNIVKYKCTDAFLNPSTILSLLNCPEVTADKMKSLRHPRCGGASLPSELSDRFKQLLPSEACFAQTYGMTELAGGFVGLPFGYRGESDEVGFLLSHCRARILDMNGQDITAAGIPGDIQVKSPTAFKGYLNNPMANAEVFTEDGWLRTGDMGFFTSEGLLKLTGRRKEAFKINSEEQVAPVEVENVLMRHPAIGDAVVYPLFDSQGVSASVHAKVVLRTGVSHLEVADLISFAKDHLADYKLPTGGVTFVSAIPRNATGKIDRAAVANH